MDEQEKENKEQPETETEVKNTKISYDDFKKVKIKVGEILSAEKIEEADRLLKLKVKFGEDERQIISGISEYYPDPQELVGKKVPFVTNLEPRKIMGYESNGMIMAALDRENSNFSLLEIDSKIPSGTDIS
ncbi:methionine--tRNA ligase subunit beta [Candidatus Parcubacteria bacterium]|nr:methionine--tRNA ligase subunit beta [Candidatus Parcubacteria bacterium]